jgi:hypothetical protein
LRAKTGQHPPLPDAPPQQALGLALRVVCVL